MFNAWKNFDERIDGFLKRKMEYKDCDFMLKALQKEIDEYLFLEKRINEVFKLLECQFKFNEELLKSIVLPDSNLFKLTNKEIILRFKYYIELFGSKEAFCKIVQNSSSFYGNDKLFSWKDMYQAKKQIDWLKELFNLDENTIKCFIINNSYFFVKDPQRLINKIQNFAKILEVDIDTIKNICLYTPSGFCGCTVERLEEKIKGFSKIFGTSDKQTKEIFIKYPFLMRRQITTFKYCSSILRKYSKNTSLMVEFPFLIDLLDYDKKICYGNFNNFDEFIENILFISNNIGAIKRAYTYTYKNKIFPFCIVKKENEKIECIALGCNKNISINKTSNIYKHKDYVLPYYVIKNLKENYIENLIKEEILKDVYEAVE